MAMHMITDEKIMGYIHSDCIRPGPLKNGYALLVTKNRIMGARKRRFGSIAAFFAEGVQIDQKYVDKAYEVKTLIEANKDFEFLVEDIKNIELKEPSTSGNGFILIKTQNDEKKLTLDWQMDDNVFGTLFRIIDYIAGLMEKTGEDKPKYCSKCGCKLEGDSSFCPGCGNKL